MKRTLFAGFVLCALLPILSCSTVDSPVAENTSARPLAATVLGEDIYTNDAAEMQDIILTRLFNQYADEQGITVSDDEIDAYVDEMQRGMRAEGLTAEDGLTPEEAAQAEQMRRDMGRAMIHQWKVNHALYEQFGGRIIFQQFGPEPLDAYRKYLEQQAAAGVFTIYRDDFKDAFWRYFTTDSMHDFYKPGSPEEARAFMTPPWEASATERTDEAVVDSERPAFLAGTQWRLVQFQSMDDTIGEIRPDNPSLYTMTLNQDGTVQMQLNCNRAMGTWSADPAADTISGRFRFDAVATTKALCPPPSMDEQIARDTQWVRGYLLRDGQLHLSLMADGGIYSWEIIPEDVKAGSFATKPDKVLEDALRAANPDYKQAAIITTGSEATYVYGRFDINQDGRPETFAYLMGPFFCGTGGCNLLLFSQSDDGYRLINNFPTSRLPVIVSPITNAGWHDLVQRKSGGGVPPSYVRYVFNGQTYVEQERLAAEPTPEGTLLLDGDYSYSSGFPLAPRKN